MAFFFLGNKKREHEQQAKHGDQARRPLGQPAKGGKFFPVCAEDGGPAVWQCGWIRILWHPTQDTEGRFVSCLKTSTRGNSFIKLKVCLDQVRLWDAQAAVARDGGSDQPGVQAAGGAEAGLDDERPVRPAGGGDRSHAEGGGGGGAPAVPLLSPRLLSPAGLSTISTLSRLSGGVLGGHKKPTWKVWKNEAPGHRKQARGPGWKNRF